MKKIANFRRFLTAAATGMRCIYYTGELARDRMETHPHPTIPGRYVDVAVEPLDSLARYVRAASDAGLVYLTQRPAAMTEDELADHINDTMATAAGVPGKEPAARRFCYQATRSSYALEDVSFEL